MERATSDNLYFSFLETVSTILNSQIARYVIKVSKEQKSGIFSSSIWNVTTF